MSQIEGSKVSDPNAPQWWGGPFIGLACMALWFGILVVFFSVKTSIMCSIIIGIFLAMFFLYTGFGKPSEVEK